MTAHPAIAFLHIGAGTVALLAGATALILRKGSRGHRTAGNAFFVSMLAMSALGASMAWVKPDIGTTIMGALTFYVTATGWMTVIRREGHSGRFEIVAMLAALALAVSALAAGLEAAASVRGVKHGYPAAFYFIVAGIASLLAFGDFRVVARRGIAGAQRLRRHLWRMCLALFVAAGSLFLGQPMVFPEPIRGTGLLSVPVLLVIGTMVFWLIRVRRKT